MIPNPFGPPPGPTPGSLKSVFPELDCLIEAIDLLKKAGFHKNLVVTSPLPRHEIEEQLYEGRPSPIRWFTMCGALFGGTSGFLTASLTHLNWPMIIPAGKPLVSIPAFIVITFEATIMMGCLFTLIGMIIMCGLPANNLQYEVTDPRFSDDVFGLVVNGLSPADAAKVRSILHSAGASEVTGMEAAHA
jgi:hypothetical protein